MAEWVAAKQGHGQHSSIANPLNRLFEQGEPGSSAPGSSMRPIVAGARGGEWPPRITPNQGLLDGVTIRHRKARGAWQGRCPKKGASHGNRKERASPMAGST